MTQIRVRRIREQILDHGRCQWLILRFGSVRIALIVYARCIGKYLSSLRKRDHVIAPKEGFEAQL